MFDLTHWEPMLLSCSIQPIGNLCFGDVRFNTLGINVFEMLDLTKLEWRFVLQEQNDSGSSKWAKDCYQQWAGGGEDAATNSWWEKDDGWAWWHAGRQQWRPPPATINELWRHYMSLGGSQLLDLLWQHRY